MNPGTVADTGNPYLDDIGTGKVVSSPALPRMLPKRVPGSGGSGSAGPLAAGPSGAGSASDRGAVIYFFSGSSFLPLSSGMYGLHGWALIGPGVFHTTLNWPSGLISPMKTGLCR